MTEDQTVTSRGALFGVLALTLSLGACANASLTSPGEDPLGGFEQKFLANTLSGLGLVPPNKERIDYAPRAPLAMPPLRARTQLPPPENRDETAANLPNWPRDPDLLRRQQALREAGEPVKFAYRENNTRLSPEEVASLRNVGPLSANDYNAGPRSETSSPLIRSSEELNRGLENLPNEGNSIFQVDETVDVADEQRKKQLGPARAEIERLQGVPGLNPDGRSTDRIDTTRLAAAPIPERRSITDPPTALRAPADDPTAGTVPEKKNKGWFDGWFGR